MNLSQFCTQSIFGSNSTYIYCVMALHHRLGLCQKCLRVQSNYIIWKMNFSAGLSFFTNLVLKHLGSVFGCHTDSSIRIYTISFRNLAAMIQCSDFLKLYNTHTGKPLVGISLIGMELMFSEYILGQYLTLMSDVISWVEEEHEKMSKKLIQKNNLVFRN